MRVPLTYYSPCLLVFVVVVFGRTSVEESMKDRSGIRAAKAMARADGVGFPASPPEPLATLGCRPPPCPRCSAAAGPSACDGGARLMTDVVSSTAGVCMLELGVVARIEGLGLRLLQSPSDRRRRHRQSDAATAAAADAALVCSPPTG